MMQNGLEEEARQLYDAVKGLDVQSIRGIGYKEWVDYFVGQLSKEATIQKIQQNSRRYAKRQLTWFRNRFEAVHWYDLVENPNTIAQVVLDCQQFLLGSE